MSAGPVFCGKYSAVSAVRCITAGGGAVKVVATGKKTILSIKIDPEVIDEDDIEMLEDLVLAAVNEAIVKAEDMVNTEMGKITGGMNIPGLM